MALLARLLKRFRSSTPSSTPIRTLRLTLPQLSEWVETNSHEYILVRGSSQSSLAHIESCKEALAQLKLATKQLSELSDSIIEKQRQLSQIEEKVERKKHDLESFMQDPLYARISIYKDQRESLLDQQKKLEAQILQFFSPLLPLFQKYVEREPTALRVHDYLKDPLSAFKNDDGLHIIHILAHLTAMLKSGNILVQEPDLIEKVKKLGEKTLHGLHSSYLQLERDKRSIYTDNTLKDFVLKVQETEYKLDHYTIQHEKVHDQVMSSQARLEELTGLLANTKSHLQHLIEKIFSRHIIITLS